MDTTTILDAIFKVRNLWNPAYFIEQASVKAMAYRMCEISIYLIVLFTVLEITRQMYENAAEDTEFKFFKPFIKIAIFTLFSVNGLIYYYGFEKFLLSPVMGITNSINNSFDFSSLSSTGIGGLDAKVKESLLRGTNIFSSLSSLTASTFIAGILFYLALIGLYITSLIQQLYVTILFIVGPLIIPTFIFEPFSDMFWTWFRKTLSVLSWSIFGTVALKIIFACGIFPLFSDSVGNNNFINMSILALGMMIICWFVPKLSDQIIGSGIDAGLSAGGMIGAATMAIATKGKSLVK